MTPNAVVAPPGPWRRWYALVILTAVYVSNIADRYVIATLIEPIKSDLHLSDTAIGFLTGTALAIFYTGMGIPLGLIADRVDRRKLIAISIGVWSVMTAACGLANNFLQLMLARIGVGTGEAGGTPASQSMIADMFPFSERVLATSVFTLGAAAGSMLGSTGGGLIADAFGWRTAFLALAIPGNYRRPVDALHRLRAAEGQARCQRRGGKDSVVERNAALHGYTAFTRARHRRSHRGYLLGMGTTLVDAGILDALASHDDR